MEKQEVDFNILPEGCISTILSKTSPQDACRFSVLSTVFKSAAESDDVWEKFLPSDYEEIISGSSSAMGNFSSKKELYFHLCDNPLLIDGGLKSFGLEKWSGKKCLMVGARQLTIIWGDTPQYWTWRPDPGSRFAEVAELLLVCWLEIYGKLESQLLSPNTLYAAYIVFKFNENAYGFHPASRGDAKIKFVGGVDSGWICRSFYFESNEEQRSQWQGSEYEGYYPQERRDGWMEIEIGRLFNDGEGIGDVEMSLFDFTGQWKSGLIVQGMELRPIVNN